MKRVLAIAMLMMAGTAHADRRVADALFKEAEADHDPVKFEACGRAYLDAYNTDPKALDGDELMFNGAICFTAAHAAGAAEQTLQSLVKTYPTSKYRGRAVLRIGQIDEVTGRFDHAAEQFEEYAHRYAGEKDALDVAENAFTYRMILGDDKKAIDDANYLVRTFGAKRPAVAASVMLRLIPVRERAGDGIAFLDGLLKTYVHQLDDSQQVIVRAKLAELQWDKTCKGRALCITEVPKDKVQRCSDGPRARVDRRTATNTAEAELVATVKVFEQRQPKDPASRHAYAMTKIRIADRAFEEYLAVPFPSGLDFSSKGKAKSLERFNAWVTEKTKLGGAVMQQYEAVLQVKDAEGSVAAAARLGQSAAGFASMLRTAEIPVDVRTGELAKDKISAFCDKMSEVAEPLAARALESFAVCGMKALELGVEGPWPAVCRRGASELDAKLLVEEPMLGEMVAIHPAPAFVPAARPAKEDPPAYAAAFEAAEKTACPTLAAPASDHGRYLEGLVAARCGRTDDARRTWEALGTAPALASLGTLHWNAGETNPAIGAWTHALKIDGKLAVAHYGLALAHFATHEKDVEVDLLSASVAEPASPDPKVMLALLSLRRAQRPEIAALYLSRIEKPTAAVYVARAVLEAHEHRVDNALQPLEEADKERWPQASYDLALLMLHRHDYATALHRLESVKQGYDALVAIGVAHAGLNRPLDAIASYTAAIQLDAARPDAHFDLGLALASQSKFHEAAEQFRLAKADALAARYGRLPQ